MLDQKEPTLDLSQDKKIKNENIVNGKVKYFNKIIKPSLEELKLHKEFLKKIKKNNFN